MNKKILAIGAHPDDIEFGAGAILIKEAAKGHSIKMLILSRGESATNGTPEQREEESRQAAGVIGAEIAFLNFGGDSHIQNTTENAYALTKEIREYKPDIVLGPQTLLNQHPDHANVGSLVRNSCRFSRYGGIAELKDIPAHAVNSLFFFPSTPNLDSRPDIYVDITDAKEAWEQVMHLHESQMKTKKYSDILLTMSHLWGMTIGVEYAWGLYKNDPLVLESIFDVVQTSPKF